LPLTCENTNVALPYIDVVNETLEYFVANSSLASYQGHDTGVAETADLMASPQFVLEKAYEKLAEARFPTILPYDRNLEVVRETCIAFDLKLSDIMQAFRKEDPPSEDSLNDVRLETAGFSKTEFSLLSSTPSSPHLLFSMYGFPIDTPDDVAVETLSWAKQFSRRLDLSYQDVVDLLQTRFVNPNSEIAPKFQKLGMSFEELKHFNETEESDAEEKFDELLKKRTSPINPKDYGGDIFKWVRNDQNLERLASLITLTETAKDSLPNSFDTLQFQFFQPPTLGASILPNVAFFVRLHRMIRLWKKTGWSIAQTDAAICALLRDSDDPTKMPDPNDIDKLNVAFKFMLPRLGAALRILDSLQLSHQKELQALLACWSPISTIGSQSLYRKLFLNKSVLLRDSVTQNSSFDDNGFGDFLTDSNQKLLTHRDSLCAAIGLTTDEFDLVANELSFTADTIFSLGNVSQVFRRGWLARKLKVSVRELLTLVKYTDLDPFQPALDVAMGALSDLSQFTRDLSSLSLKPSILFLLVWNDDWSGKTTLTDQQHQQLATLLRADHATIEGKYSVNEGPLDSLIKTRLAIIYPSDVVDTFWGVLTDTSLQGTPYTQSEVSLSKPIVDAARDSSGTRLAYDSARHLLTFRGAMSTKTRDKLIEVPDVSDEFKQSISVLFSQILSATATLFTGRYEELQPLYGKYRMPTTWPTHVETLTFSVDYEQTEPILADSIGEALGPEHRNRIKYDAANKLLTFNGELTSKQKDALKSVPGVSDTFQRAIDRLVDAQATAEKSSLEHETISKQQALLTAINPHVIAAQKKLQTLTRLSEIIGGDLEKTEMILDDQSGIVSKSDPKVLGWEDFNSVVQEGWMIQFYSDIEPTESPASSGSFKALRFEPAIQKLPDGTKSVVIEGYLEVSETNLFNLFISTNKDATVSLTLDTEECELTLAGDIRQNKNPLDWKAGTLIKFSLTVKGITQNLNIQWETPVRLRETIPARWLVPSDNFKTFCDAHSRFVKVAQLGTALDLTAAELRRPQVGGHSWLNAIPVSSKGGTSLREPLLDLLAYSTIKADVGLPEGELFAALADPATTTPPPLFDPLLLALNTTIENLNKLLEHFHYTRAALADGTKLRRLIKATEIIRTLGISASNLVESLTNSPTFQQANKFWDALRARYDNESWRGLIQPINDKIRIQQRDALIAYILHRLRESPETRHVNTADKLFEYLLMDVQMEPIVQTSRVRHALSSVQLFIQRCLMNLEPEVSPRSLVAKRWDWMKRYRVWEANRKVFLFPENWIEPELRDDKSSFFKELESELLQSDITEDTAAVAMLTYLHKLSEVAQLEISGTFHIEANEQANTGEIDHVVARTSGAHRKYYYRRRDGGSWSSWEHIKLDIEDNPVQPVVWKDRLFIFWLRILQEAPLDPKTITDAQGDAKADGTELTKANFSDARNAAVGTANQTMQVTFQAMLCYSEFAGGKWLPTKTSDVQNPMVLKTCLISKFDRSQVRLSVGMPASGRLNIGVSGTGNSQAFTLYNTHSLPVITGDLYRETQNRQRYFEKEENALIIRYTSLGKIVDGDIYKPNQLIRTLFTSPLPHGIVQSIQDMTDCWTAPFFYSDSRCVFYVRTMTQQIQIFYWDRFGINDNRGVRGIPHIPPIYVEVDPSIFHKPKLWGDGGPVDPGGLRFDPGLIKSYIRGGGLIRQGLGAAGTLLFDGRAIGPSGTLVIPGNVQTGVQPQ